MSNKKSNSEARAEAFGLEIDPLQEMSEELAQLEEQGNVDEDPLEEYVRRIQREATSNVEETIKHYERTFRQWRDHMEVYGRHPACPSKQHVLDFIDYWLNEGNKPGTVKKKVERLWNAYQWWQASSDFPHELEYDPFDGALQERNLEDSGVYQKKKPPRVTLDEIRDVIHSITDIADRAIVGLQLKWGCRSSELGNIKLSEVHLDHPEVLEHYSEMGSHDQLQDRPNSVYIPPDRRLNKRERPTVLPLDEEARRLLIDWLLVRPDTGDPWLFMTHKGKQLSRTDIRYIWTKYWWPEYEFDADGQYSSVTPKFARHRFSTYWMNDLSGVNREWVKYMRGDQTDRSMGTTSDALDHYIHTYFEDIRQLYEEKMYQLYV